MISRESTLLGRIRDVNIRESIGIRKAAIISAAMETEYGINDEERAEAAIAGIVGQRLTYQISHESLYAETLTHISRL
ncbi:MAG: hypothetical protein DHS20C05_06230 [Hyphococcus sp.]|nr:MAG: hypothetical protein DHS20C05_06230 [Marinicaulis sp.]